MHRLIEENMQEESFEYEDISHITVSTGRSASYLRWGLLWLILSISLFIEGSYYIALAVVLLLYSACG